eukprot:m.458010 g.458010  ORF g.458010 m.458010 type:complete len:320 (+) comp56984_c0_seq1:334-1293(+)
MMVCLEGECLFPHLPPAAGLRIHAGTARRTAAAHTLCNSRTVRRLSRLALTGNNGRDPVTGGQTDVCVAHTVAATHWCTLRRAIARLLALSLVVVYDTSAAGLAVVCIRAPLPAHWRIVNRAVAPLTAMAWGEENKTVTVEQARVCIGKPVGPAHRSVLSTAAALPFALSKIVDGYAGTVGLRLVQEGLPVTATHRCILSRVHTRAAFDVWGVRRGEAADAGLAAALVKDISVRTEPTAHSRTADARAVRLCLALLASVDRTSAQTTRGKSTETPFRNSRECQQSREDKPAQAVSASYPNSEKLKGSSKRTQLSKPDER